MAQIQPITTFFNGKNVELNNIELRSIGDNLSLKPLKGQASLYYELQNVTTTEDVTTTENVITATLELTGADYDSWNSDPTSNQWALNWAANKLNLILI